MDRFVYIIWTRTKNHQPPPFRMRSRLPSAPTTLVPPRRKHSLSSRLTTNTTPTTVPPTELAALTHVTPPAAVSWRPTRTTGSSTGAMMERAVATEQPASRTLTLESAVVKTQTVLLLLVAAAAPRFYRNKPLEIY